VWNPYTKDCYKENKLIHPLQIDPKPCKYFYWQFIDKATVVPVNIIHKLSNEFDIEETEWGLIFSESFSISKTNKLWCFQYKLIHRILALNPFLGCNVTKKLLVFSHGLPKKYRWKQCKLDSKRYYLEKCTVWK
jgi:hypothetical protein